MDTDRLKKNLRLISGRSKKSKNGTSPSGQDGQISTSDSATARPSVQQILKSGKAPSFAQLISRRDLEGQEKHIESEKRGETAAGSEPSELQLDSNYGSPSLQQHEMEPTTNESVDDFQLDAPPPRSSISTVEGLSDLLFSAEHLQYIIQDPLLFSRFAQFLSRFRPRLMPILLHHMEIQKATKALEYANAVAANLGPFPGEENSQGLQSAAAMNKDLDVRRRRIIEILLAEALPTQITYSLVQVVTDAMQKSIRGTAQTPIMRNLIGGLTEVFVLTDPSKEDNPIIYASEEFYRMTGYGRDFVIGRNCRFLQGPKTLKESVYRLKRYINDGVEISETLLNYRRDGTPFMNLLMVAPLHDSKGNIKYQIGAQVDVSGLVEEGQGLDGFDTFLASRKRRQEEVAAAELKKDKGKGQGNAKKAALEKLGELAEMFDVAESAIVRSNSRSNSITKDSGYASSPRPNIGRGQNNNRRILIDDSDELDSGQEEEDDQNTQKKLADRNEMTDWKLAPPSAATGKLPGVYQKYLLLRPASSNLRVIFVSPALRELGGLLRKPLLECITASAGTMEGLKDAFGNGAPVSAKVGWKEQIFSAQEKNSGGNSGGSQNDSRSQGREQAVKAKSNWISATPMLGSDDSIGVWMIVVVENTQSQSSTRSSRPWSKRYVAGKGRDDADADPETGSHPPLPPTRNLDSKPQANSTTTSSGHNSRTTHDSRIAREVPDPRAGVDVDGADGQTLRENGPSPEEQETANDAHKDDSKDNKVMSRHVMSTESNHGPSRSLDQDQDQTQQKPPLQGMPEHETKNADKEDSYHHENDNENNNNNNGSATTTPRPVQQQEAPTITAIPSPAQPGDPALNPPKSFPSPGKDGVETDDSAIPSSHHDDQDDRSRGNHAVAAEVKDQRDASNREEENADDNDGKDGKDDDEQQHQYLPISKTIWSKPPRPSLPGRMISID